MPEAGGLPACRAEWAEWGQQEGEARERYELRIRDTFLFDSAQAQRLPPHLVSEVYQDGSERSQRGALPGALRASHCADTGSSVVLSRLPFTCTCSCPTTCLHLSPHTLICSFYNAQLTSSALRMPTQPFGNDVQHACWRRRQQRARRGCGAAAAQRAHRAGACRGFRGPGPRLALPARRRQPPPAHAAHVGP
jgi:hypothetical protein